MKKGMRERVSGDDVCDCSFGELLDNKKPLCLLKYKLSRKSYPLRNGSDMIILFCRLSKTYDAFIPSTIRQWNGLDPSLRNVDYIAKFKTELRKRKDISQVPKHYEIGSRKLNIILNQLGCFASFLNYDLLQVNIVSDPSCHCSANREDSYQENEERNEREG
jgi:hypothetical protein